MLARRFLLFPCLVLILCAVFMGAQTRTIDPAATVWHGKMTAARDLVRDTLRARGIDDAKADEVQPRAVSMFEEALAYAPDSEHAADTLLHLAESYEAFTERQKTISTYERLVTTYPTSGHVPYAYQRLGDFNNCVTLAPTKADSEETRAVARNMSPFRAMECYEKAIALGGPASSAVLSSKAALIIIYTTRGRRDEAWRFIEDFANLSVEDVTEPDYVGPFREMSPGAAGSPESRIKEARSLVVRCREGAPRLAVRWCKEKDDAKTVENLKGLMLKYPESDIAKAAAAELGGGIVEARVDPSKSVEPFAEEVKAFEKRICSGDAAVRYEAVREAQATRQAIAEALIAMVSDANSGVINDRSKAYAIFTAGELMLVQCRDTLEKERDWEYKPDDGMITGTAVMFRGRIIGYVARDAQRKLTLSSGVRVTRAPVPSGDLAAWPALSQAISDMRVDEMKTAYQGSEVLVKWYNAMCRGLYECLGNEGMGSTDAAITCAFLLGEFRAYDPSALRKQIEIEDTKGLCRTYPATLAVDTVDDLHPCTVALVKCGNRVLMRCCVDFLTMEWPSQKARDLVADAMILIDPTEARAHYERLVSELTGDARSAYPDPDVCLLRLRSVESTVLR